MILARFETAAFADAVRRFGIRSTVLPPAAMAMLSDDEAIIDLAPLRYVRSISSPLSPSRPAGSATGSASPSSTAGARPRSAARSWDGRPRTPKPSATTKLGAVGRPHDRASTTRATPTDRRALGADPSLSARATPTAPTCPTG